MLRTELARHLDELLAPSRLRDYCPNGLQVEGSESVTHLVTGVTASLALIERARAAGADAILVHHGYFWKNEDPRIVGLRRRRIAMLIAHDINLFAYHLPLDVHPELGNNAQLGLRLGWIRDGWCGDQDMVALGTVRDARTAREVTAAVGVALGRAPLFLGDPDRTVRRVAWCTGGAQGYFQDAIDAGVDLYLTGEASEQHHHLAEESGVGFIAAGHHATERFGVQAVGAHLVARFGLRHTFIDVQNPV